MNKWLVPERETGMLSMSNCTDGSTEVWMEDMYDADEEEDDGRQ